MNDPNTLTQEQTAKSLSNVCNKGMDAMAAEIDRVFSGAPPVMKRSLLAMAANIVLLRIEHVTITEGDLTPSKWAERQKQLRESFKETKGNQ